jgi:hypothetical protein
MGHHLLDGKGVAQERTPTTAHCRRTAVANKPLLVSGGSAARTSEKESEEEGGEGSSPGQVMA